ncbi:MAG TPA: CehA/McbA family metallohydrolase, partial [Polyangiaceae bacterium]
MRRAVLLSCLVLAAAACPPHEDVTPLIHVDPHAAGRLDWFAKPAASSDTPGKPKPARVHVMKDGEQLGGPAATGRPGDLLLENDEVAFVIDQLGSSTGFAESGGNLLDAADAHARKDELGQLFTYFGTFPRQGVYDTLTSGTGEDGSAWVEARGRELFEARVNVTTRYTLQAPDRAVLIETVLTNTGDAPVTIPSLGDAVQWGGAEKVAPGKTRGFKGPSSGAFVGGVGRFTSYALTSDEGAVDGISGSSWTDTAQRKNVTLDPHGGAATYRRVFVVGPRPDTSSIVAELAMAAGEPTGALEVKLEGGALGTGEVLSLKPVGGTEAMTLAAPYAAQLPAGRYEVTVPGANGAKGTADVKRDTAVDLSLKVDARATLTLGCGGPCKLTVEGTGGTATPDFGPSHAAGPARNQVTTRGDAVSVLVAPGKYHVTASRGPEYALDATDVELASGATRAVTLTPKRVVDTAGYIGCDFHQHTILGADSPVAMGDRVVSNVAEGVEVSVASEHNVIADLEPLVRGMHLEDAMVAISGDELTTDASRKPWGHANVWPMPLDASKPRGGSPPLRDLTAKQTFDALRSSLKGDWVLQVNHPRMGPIGYFELLHFDPARGIGTGDGYDAGFDALEVWNGRNVGSRDQVIDDWRALLRTGHAVTPTADTDTHGIVGWEAGYPRTYVRVADDGNLASWDASRTQDVVHGVKALRDVVLTNGPMLRVTANGATPVGGIVRATGPRAVTLRVHIECAPWVSVDTVSVMHVLSSEKPVTKPVILAPTSTGAMAADLVLSATTRADDALYVVATGSKPMTPVLAGDPKEITP